MKCSDSDTSCIESELGSDTCDTTEELLYEKCRNQGRKRKRFPQLRKNERNKKRKSSGQSYTNKKGEKVVNFILSILIFLFI